MIADLNPLKKADFAAAVLVFVGVVLLTPNEPLNGQDLVGLALLLAACVVLLRTDRAAQRAQQREGP